MHHFYADVWIASQPQRIVQKILTVPAVSRISNIHCCPSTSTCCMGKRKENLGYTSKNSIYSVEFSSSFGTKRKKVLNKCYMDVYWVWAVKVTLSGLYSNDYPVKTLASDILR